MSNNAIWLGLVANLAIVALFTSIWSQALVWLDARPRRIRKALTGGLIGFGAIGTMVLTVELQPGVYFDLRTTIITVGSFFGGPVVAVIAVLGSAAYRVLVGGAGMPIGVLSLLTAAVLGLLVRTFLGSPAPRRMAILALALAVSASRLILPMLLPQQIASQVMAEAAVPAALMTLFSTLLMGFTLLHTRAHARERYLLRTAIAQAPDYQYVKDRNGAFITANMNVVSHNGFRTPAELAGKTDFDLFASDHAQKLFEQEREIVRTGRGIVDFEELIVDAQGADRWYRTSKAPLLNGDGGVIGIAGVTVDITAQKRLETEVMESRNLLALALAEMSNGLALFGADERLVFCNDQFLLSFPLTANVRLPGTPIRTILEAVVRTGEELGIPADGEAWIERVIAAHKIEAEGEIALRDGRFLQRRNRPVPGGGFLIVVSDVTELKQAEGMLRAANAELVIQASTDGLTGLTNRRSFDALLAKELDRSARDRGPCALLMIDADHFKSYNDLYGHQAGDDCLRAIAACLKASLRRPADVAARYGGEEFAVILPDTDEAGAAVVAQGIRRKLRQRTIPHEGNAKGQVTVSIGLAWSGAEARTCQPEEILGRADEALYLAKSCGRDRLSHWRDRLSA